MTLALPHQHTTAGWATAFTGAFQAAATTTTVLIEGRRLVASGATGPIAVQEGFASTVVTQPDGTTIRPRLAVPVLTEQQWTTAYAAIAADPLVRDAASTSNVTDLLTDPARTGGVSLIPSPTSFSFTCACGQKALCAHTAAVGYLIADRARTAPGLLFTLRGRSHSRLRTYLRQHAAAPPQQTDNAPPADRPQNAERPACAAKDDGRLPSAPPPPPPAAASPPEATLDVPVLPTQGIRTAALPPLPPIDTSSAMPLLNVVTEEPPSPLPALATMRALAQDAAQRATSLLQGHAPQALDTLTDIVRFTTETGGAHLSTAADHLGLSPLQMRHLSLAYEHGGPHGVSTYLTPHTADPGTLADAEAAIQPLRPSPHAPVERHHNQLTDQPAGVQLRHGADGRWYPYIDRYGTWQPAAAPHPDPAVAYKAARTARRQRG